MKLIYLYTAITWYRLELFKEISKQCETKFFILNDFNYDNTDYKKLNYTPDYDGLDISFLNKTESKFENLCNRLDQLEFDAIVVPSMNGIKYLILTNKLAKYYKQRNKQVLYFWEYWPLEDSKASYKRRVIQKLKNCFVKRASKYIDSFLTTSNYELAYYLSLNIPSEKLIKIPNVSEFKEAKTVDIRSEWGLTRENIIVLYLGRLEDYKGVNELVEVFSTIDNKNIFLLLCGSGEIDEERFKKYRNIIFTGAISPADRYKYFSSADIFVLPNNYNGKIEAWGLTVNEAMYYSLPVIVTNATGASFDLVYNNVNGYVLDSNHIKEELLIAITTLAEDEQKRKMFGRNSKNIISTFSFYNMASVFVYCAGKKSL